MDRCPAGKVRSGHGRNRKHRRRSKARAGRPDLIADNAETDAVRTVVDRAARDQKRPATVDAFWKLMKNGEKLVTPEEWAVLQYHVRRNGSAGLHRSHRSRDQRRRCPQGLRRHACRGRGLPDRARQRHQLPTSDGTTRTGELIGENTTATGADPSFGVVTLKT